MLSPKRFSAVGFWVGVEGRWEGYLLGWLGRLVEWCGILDDGVWILFPKEPLHVNGLTTPQHQQPCGYSTLLTQD